MAVERPTFHESWYRVAALRPRLRTTVQTHRQHFRGERWHVVQDPANNAYFRLDDAGYHFVGLLDGRRSVEEAWIICNEHLGDRAPTQGEVISLLGQLYTSNLLQSDLPADATGMFENYRVRRQREIRGFVSSFLFMRIPLLDPDAMLERWVRVFGVVFTPVGFAAWLGLLAAAGFALAGRFDALASGIDGVLAPGNLFLLYTSFAVVKAVHEFGHAFASKRIGRLTGRGGAVHTMGITLLVLTPVPYIDASSSWAFRSKWHRALVGAAGMYVELAIAAGAAIVWANTSPGVVHALAYNMIFVASVSTLLFNGNPLLRFDAYYILSDLLEVPNLSRRSRDQLGYLVRRHVYGVRHATPAALTPGEHRWLPVYGLAAIAYQSMVSVGIILFLSEKFFFLGVLLALMAAATFLLVPLGRFARYLALAPELGRVRRRAVLTSLVIAALLVGGLGVVPVPEHARAEGMVEPVELAVVYAEVDGFADAVLPTGRSVEPEGAALVRAHNAELEAKRLRLVADHRLAQLERDRASVNEVSLAQSLTERLAALDEQIDRVESQLEALAVRAPVAGRWIAHDADRLRGAYLERGAEIGVVASVDRLLVRAVADQELGPRIEPELGPGAPVEIRLRGRPDLELSGRVREVLPAGMLRLPSAALGYGAGGATQVATGDDTGTRTVEPFFEVHVELDDDAAQAAHLCSGQRVEVRFAMPARPLMAQAWRALRQLVQRRFRV